SLVRAAERVFLMTPRRGERISSPLTKNGYNVCPKRDGGGMLTGELRSKIDGVWNAFWAGGIANPLEVIEQITYLLFMRGLDEAHTREENRANRLKKPFERRIFPKAKDGIGKNGGVAY